MRSAVKNEADLTGNVMANQDPPPEAMTDPWSMFGDDPESSGEFFEHLRKKLIYYFQARRCEDPEDLAQETLARVMRKLGEQVKVDDITRYSYGVAKNVRLEHLRQKERERAIFDEQQEQAGAATTDEVSTDDKEQRLKCMEKCAADLSEGERRLMADYTNGKGRDRQERRRRMAEELDISLVALRLRIFSLRSRLRECFEKCMKES